jgi:hypothetical protein
LGHRVPVAAPHGRQTRRSRSLLPSRGAAGSVPPCGPERMELLSPPRVTAAPPPLPAPPSGGSLLEPRPPFSRQPLAETLAGLDGLPLPANAGFLVMPAAAHLAQNPRPLALPLEAPESLLQALVFPDIDSWHVDPRPPHLGGRAQKKQTLSLAMPAARCQEKGESAGPEGNFLPPGPVAWFSGPRHVPASCSKKNSYGLQRTRRQVPKCQMTVSGI